MNTLRAIVGAVVLMAGTCWAAEPETELTADGALSLIKLLLEDYQEKIDIAIISEGTAREGSFEKKHVRRVVAVHPVPEEGKRVRRMQCYDFEWNEEYGWFTWEKRVARGGDEIWIWSEKKGEVVIR